MSSPTTTTPPPDTGFDPVVFWIAHKGKILLFTGLFIVALAAYAISEVVNNKRTAAAETAFANAHTADDYRKLIADYSGTTPAGSSYLLLADRQRAEGKFDESSATLHTFLEKYPQHPLVSGAWTSIAANLEAQGKADEALTAYQKVSTTYANSFSAPLALNAQARLLAQKGKKEEARRIYEQIMAQYQDNYIAQLAAEELRKLKK